MSSGSVTIYFKGGSGRGSRSGINSNGSIKRPKIDKEKEKLERLRQRMIARNVERVLKEGSAIILGIISYQMQKGYNLTDNVQAQRDRTIALNWTKKTFSLAQNIAFGASVGGVWGAVISGSLSIIQNGISIYEGYDQQTIKIKQLNEQLEYTRLRAGYSLTSGDKGENR